MKQETLDIYTLDQHNETVNWISKMAIRFKVTPEDVMYALWTIAKDTVWAKLERDAKAKKEQIKKEGAKAK